jgi:hypothetical protein
MKISERLKNFKTWQSEAKDSLVIPCRNHYGDHAFFESHEGVIMIGFGDEEGFEPDKDAIKFDKEDLPKVIAFLKKALKEG